VGLLRVAEITGRAEFRKAAETRLREVLDWQSDEGWFDEYGGADPGYQTVTIDSLLTCRALLGAAWLDEPIRRAVAFCRLFLHPDDSYGGEYGSRGTYHFYPHGFERLAGSNADAADLADAFLRSLAMGKQAWFDDDRMFAHRLANLIEAYRDWSPQRPAAVEAGRSTTSFLRQAQLLIDRSPERHVIISAARGGVFKHFATSQCRDGSCNKSVSVTTDAGLIAEFADGRLAVSQSHDLTRQVSLGPLQASDLPVQSLIVSGALHWVSTETFTPLKFALFRLGMWAVGRWCRTLVRRALQRRLITGRRTCPLRLTRRFELPAGDAGQATLRVIDMIELTAPSASVRRMSFGVDHQSAYVAASGVYQDSVLQPWIDLSQYVDELNNRRRVTIVRDL
jgi:hypothetical protein